MAIQLVNLGTSANKGDGDPLRIAFDKVNDNFQEVYSDIKQLNSANFGGGTLVHDTVGNVIAHDSTLLVDANGGEIVGPLASASWQTTSAIDIDSTQDDIDITASGVLTLENASQTDYITIANTGVTIYSDSNIAIQSAGNDIQIGYDVASGDVQMGHNSSQVVVNGTFDAKRFAKIEAPTYDTATRNGLVVNNGTIIYNNVTLALEAYVDGAWVSISQQDVSEFSDNTGLIPSDLSDLTDNTVLIKTDVSQLADATNLIPTNIGDLVSGGNVGDMLVKTSTGYGFTAPVPESFTLSDIKTVAAASADFADFQSRIAAL